MQIRPSAKSETRTEREKKHRLQNQAGPIFSNQYFHTHIFLQQTQNEAERFSYFSLHHFPIEQRQQSGMKIN